MTWVPGTPARVGVPVLPEGGQTMINVTVSERYADPPICLYDPESRICFVPGRVVELDERALTMLQKGWLGQGALVTVEAEEGAVGDTAGSGSENQVSNLEEMSYIDLYRKAKQAGLRYAVTPKKARLIEDLAAAQKAAGLLTRPEGVHHG
jgi:hypothetical protein